MEKFLIDIYIKEKLDAKQKECPGKNLRGYKFDLADVRDEYEEEVESFNSQLTKALKKGKEKYEISRTYSTNPSKMDFVSQKALDNFLIDLTEQGHTLTEETFPNENQEGKVIRRDITVTLTRLEKLA